MGSSETTLRKKKYLTKEEIEVDVSRNIYLLPIFKKIKNSDGQLTTNELNTITYGLINPKIRKKIIQICGSKIDKLNLEDLCYFYSLLNTTLYDAKLNFLYKEYPRNNSNKFSNEKYKMSPKNILNNLKYKGLKRKNKSSNLLITNFNKSKNNSNLSSINLALSNALSFPILLSSSISALVFPKTTLYA